MTTPAQMDLQHILTQLYGLAPAHRPALAVFNAILDSLLVPTLQSIVAKAQSGLDKSSTPEQQLTLLREIARVGNVELAQFEQLLDCLHTLDSSPVATVLALDHFTGVRALVIDDDVARRAEFQAFLQTYGLRSDGAQAEAALATLQSALQGAATYHMVIMCAEHFEHHAAYLGRTLKANPHYQGIMPVLALATEKTPTFEIERALFSGFNCVLNHTERTTFAAKLATAWQGWLSKTLATAPLPTTMPAILVVEDELTAQFSAQQQLLALHYRVDLAADGQTALQLCARNQYALIFMDIGLPDMSGLEITAEIRRREHDRAKTPIIGLTIYALEDDEKQGLEIGMDDYLVKPLMPERLRAILQKWLTPSLS